MSNLFRFIYQNFAPLRIIRIETMNRLKKIYPALVTLLVSTLLLYMVFGGILQSPNYVFFAPGGDGLKSTYGSYYHLQYDTSYWHAASMAYPYGESVLFTGSQALIVNPLKWLAAHGLDLSDYLTGIINTWELFSIVLGALFLFLLFRELKLPWWYALIAANIIIFLSPQQGRFGGHYNLAYMYFLPLYMYLLKRFFDKPTFKLSGIIALLVLWALGTQAYFFALYAFWIFFLLLYGYFFRKEEFGNPWRSLLHLVIQLGLPFVVFNLFTMGYANDRSAFPWGFFASRSFPEAVFLPAGKIYAPFIHISYLKWEGMAFVGMVASIGFLILLWKFIKNSRLRPRQLKSFTGNGFLDAMLLGAGVALLISFAWPFTWNLEFLLKYTGPFRQFRAIGRFNWLFYYTLNVAVFYLLWNFYAKRKTPFATIVLILAIAWGTFDAYLQVRGGDKWLNHHIPQLADSQNKEASNAWVNGLQKDEFQAVLALPFFHIGSEVYWIGHSAPTEKSVFLVSWKTGLPLIDVMLSRTSISHTVKALSLYMEPLSPYPILNDLPNRKDILLMVQKGEELNTDEQRLIAYALPYLDAEDFRLYRLRIDSLEKISSDYRGRILREGEDTTLIASGDFRLSGDGDFFFGWDSSGKTKPAIDLSKGSIRFAATQTKLLDLPFALKANKEYTLSFWMKDLDKDLIPRTQIWLSAFAQGKWNELLSITIFKKVKYIGPDGWGLVEFSFKTEEKASSVRLIFSNDLMAGGNLEVSSLLLRASECNVFYRTNDFVFKNNRYIRK